MAGGSPPRSYRSVLGVFRVSDVSALASSVWLMSSVSRASAPRPRRHSRLGAPSRACRERRPCRPQMAAGASRLNRCRSAAGRMVLAPAFLRDRILVPSWWTHGTVTVPGRPVPARSVAGDSTGRSPEECVVNPSQTKQVPAVDETSNAALHADLASALHVLVRATDEHAAMLSDPDTIQEDRDASAQFLAQARAAVTRVETALARAEAGSYGRCQRCGSMIPEERLAAIRATLTCVACA